MDSSSTRQYSREDVALHNKKGDLWVVIDSKVFDLSKFANLHPGGLAVLLDKSIAGKDATEAFFGLHRFDVLQRPQYARLQIGVIGDETPSRFPREDGALSMVPYAEPAWLTEGLVSPYYKDHHRAFQKETRKLVDKIIFPDAQAVQENGEKPSQHVFDEMTKVNLNAMRLGPGEHLKGRTLMNGTVTPEQFDYFHELILFLETTRLHARGYHDGLAGGTAICLPIIANFARQDIRERVLNEIFDGKKLACLAISEAYAGSDVSKIQTNARKTKDGKHWIVNGTKKWITNGNFADYFVTACATDKGLNVLLIERGEGVATRHVDTGYGHSAGTAYITFDDVQVPVEHTLGPEGGGLNVILSNFNHERWGIAASTLGAQRMIVEECMKWAAQRKVFGRPLNSQPIIRSKLAAMIIRIETAQAWLEHITYQMANMNFKQDSSRIAGQIALLKVHCSQSAQETARDAVQIFGGRGLTKTGMGKYIQRYTNAVMFDSILGGTEDVLGDLGVRLAIKQIPRNSLL
ncbi:hypothetical protein AMATHDRAFT_55444 [Amanita thiersii Skay4041]|uniref:Cytochrome b5 heme-binding domain-containing protein n=1 Tax=Amanita thiersii Skay4041 TaxID=703135 RepID=A0A2A9NUM7_9AGAR|nr:hypothetical protein AMATHDRAFT_55444 [Amanita thiersii Skay4041]